MKWMTTSTRSVAVFSLMALVCAPSAFAQSVQRDDFYWLGQINKASAVINRDEGLLDKAVAPKIARGLKQVLDAGDAPKGDVLAAAEAVKRVLRTVPMTNKVDIIGRQPEKVYVEFSSRKLATMGVSPQALISALSGRLAMTPAGAVEAQPVLEHALVRNRVLDGDNR